MLIIKTNISFKSLTSFRNSVPETLNLILFFICEHLRNLLENFVFPQIKLINADSVCANQKKL